MEELKRQIKILEDRVAKLEAPMSYDLSEGLKDRFFENRGASSTQELTTLAEGAKFNVPKQPTGTLTLVYKGTRYHLLYE